MTPISLSVPHCSSPSVAPRPKDSDKEPISNPNAGLSSPLNIQALNVRKLPAEAMGQVTDQTARRLRLSPEGIHELTEYPEMPAPYQIAWPASSLISLSDQIKALIPAKPVHYVPSVLEGKIDQYVFSILVDPEASTYITAKLT
ncbi:hypothetical protein B0H10DRAFT_1944631 [Mycena sp. CBHHK59/15]|nr:hypothetical protein B0H10DRAFT_1944631 [Mycena sp. CBHHK59/15]